MKKKHTPICPNFVYPEITDAHYRFGANNAGEIIRKDGDWRSYLPIEEYQNVRGIESSSCFIQAQQSAIATLQEEMYQLPDQNYSARFNFILSDGTEYGGDPLKAADSIRKDGMIPDSMMPFDENIKTWNDFASWLGANDDACYAAGRLWLKRWKPNNYIVFTKNEEVGEKYKKLREALKRGTVVLSVYAWTEKDGVYIKPKGSRDQHLVEGVYLDEKNRLYIRDSYAPFIKILEPNFNSDFCMKWTLKKMIDSPSFWDKLRDFFNSFNKKEIINDIKVDIQPELVEKVVPLPTNTEHLLEVAKGALGTEVTPNDEVPDEVACAQTLSTLLKKVHPDFPILSSTKDLDWKLYSDKRFERVLEPEAGCLIVSPRTATRNGHCGVFMTDKEIASNTSRSGLFQNNYSYQGWIRKFAGLHIYIYKLL